MRNIVLIFLALVFTDINVKCIKYEYVGVGYENSDNASIPWNEFTYIDIPDQPQFYNYLLANIQFSDDDLLVDKIEFYAATNGTIILCFINCDLCDSLPVGGCANTLESASSAYFFVNENKYVITARPGLNTFIPPVTYNIPKKSFLGLIQYNPYVVAIDTSGTASDSDYLIVPIEDSENSTLSRLNNKLNNRFYISVNASKIDSNSLKFYGMEVSSAGITNDRIRTFNTSLYNSIFFILQNSTFIKDSVITGIEIYAFESTSIEFGYIDNSACPDNITSTCLEYITNQSSVLQSIFQVNSITLNVEVGKNILVFDTNLNAPQGSFLYLSYPDQFSIKKYSLLVESNLQNQSNLDYYFNCVFTSTRCNKMPLNSKINIKVNYTTTDMDVVNFGGSLPSNLNVSQPNFEEYFVMPEIEITRDSVLYGYELYTAVSGPVLMGLLTYDSCNSSCANKIATLNTLDPAKLELYARHRVELLTDNTYIQNFDLRTAGIPLYARAGSLLFTQRQFNFNFFNGRIAMQTNSSLMDLKLNCTPDCFTKYPISEYNNTRLLMRAIVSLLNEDTYKGVTVPNSLTNDQYTTYDFVFERNECFILNNIKLTYDGVVAGFEIYADKAGAIRIDLMNYNCTSECPLDLFETSNDFQTLSDKYGVLFQNYATLNITLVKGYNLHKLDEKLFYYANSYVVLYQFDARVAVDSVNNGLYSDFYLFGSPYVVETSTYDQLNTSSNYSFFVRAIINEVTSELTTTTKTSTTTQYSVSSSLYSTTTGSTTGFISTSKTSTTSVSSSSVNYTSLSSYSTLYPLTTTTTPSNALLEVQKEFLRAIFRYLYKILYYILYKNY